MILDKIENPEDIKKLTIKEKKQLAKEIRKLIIKVVLEKGGHLSSNLGVVELTIALYSQIDLEKDKVIWDVGHQTYTHKILTGRKKLFSTLRQKNGISGFPKREESKYDAFNTGHSSTSISAALGMARARDILKEDKKIYAVIGDGAITSGIALEGLNDTGISDTDITIILNDNQMSISKNTGGFSKFLSNSTKKFSPVSLSSSINNTLSFKLGINSVPCNRFNVHKLPPIIVPEHLPSLITFIPSFLIKFLFSWSLYHLSSL